MIFKGQLGKFAYWLAKADTEEFRGESVLMLSVLWLKEPQIKIKTEEEKEKLQP